MSKFRFVPRCPTVGTGCPRVADTIWMLGKPFSWLHVDFILISLSDRTSDIFRSVQNLAQLQCAVLCAVMFSQSDQLMFVCIDSNEELTVQIVFQIVRRPNQLSQASITNRFFIFWSASGTWSPGNFRNSQCVLCWLWSWARVSCLHTGCLESTARLVWVFPLCLTNNRHFFWYRTVTYFLQRELQQAIQRTDLLFVAVATRIMRSDASLEWVGKLHGWNLMWHVAAAMNTRPLPRQFERQWNWISISYAHKACDHVQSIVSSIIFHRPFLRPFKICPRVELTGLQLICSKIRQFKTWSSFATTIFRRWMIFESERGRHALGPWKHSMLDGILLLVSVSLSGKKMLNFEDWFLDCLCDHEWFFEMHVLRMLQTCCPMPWGVDAYLGVTLTHCQCCLSDWKMHWTVTCVRYISHGTSQ